MLTVREEYKKGIAYYRVREQNSQMYNLEIAIHLETASQTELKWLLEDGAEYIDDTPKKGKASE